MDSVIQKHGVNMVYFMLTNIIEETTELIYEGSNAEELIIQAFNTQPEEGGFILKGVVSRKKQLIPGIIEAIQQ